MILYLTEQGLKLTKESERFLIHYPGKNKKAKEVRISDTEEIYIFGKISLSPPVIQTCLKRKIPVHFLSASGDYLGSLKGFTAKNIELRVNQFQNYFDFQKRINLAKSIVKGKILGQIKVISELKRRYHFKPFEGTIFRLNLCLKDLEKAERVDILMGIEGTASKIYFEALTLVFKKLGWEFPGRVKRPPTDPVNALLSLGYTLLFSKVLSFVEACGLDPYLGFLHSTDYGKPSLVLDLIEEWRSLFVDTLVIRCLSWKVITPNDFTDKSLEEEEVYTIKLTPSGLKKFISQFQQKLKEESIYPPLEKKLKTIFIFKEQVYQFARVLKGEKNEYIPYVYF
ncbi:MAG: CRISPR-associated endonuclease Cas1 [Thermodesulfobacteria bacterium]|nr:CRISPR-associated endonuclease Cas1 [Thermodesulfobacteriota bacterium]